MHTRYVFGIPIMTQFFWVRSGGMARINLAQWGSNM